MPTQTAKRKSKSLDNLLIRASAGTGKTYQLANRYLALLQRGVPPERILATTFTRKAAAEILDRIVTKLATAAVDDEELAKLSTSLQLGKLTRNECLTMLRSVLRNLHRLRISTLDSLFGQIARAFSLEMGLPPAWRIVDESEDADVRELAIEAVLRQHDSPQLLALTHLLSKGEATRGIGELVRETVTTLHGLYQEAPQNAWYALPRHKLLNPVELALLVDELRQLSFAENKRAGTARDVDYQHIVKGEWEQFATKGIAAKLLAGESTYYSKPIPQDAINLYERLLEQARAELINRVVFQTEGSHELLHRFDEQRRRWQQEHRGLRFDDVSHALAVALQEDVAMAGTQAGLSHRLDGATSHLLLDEFQDTSPRQWRALRPFVSGSTQDDGHSSFFCVGDVKQAIYGWRGGVAEIFDAIEQQVPGLVLQPLVESFRSSQPVIDLVNRVFQHAHEHPRLERCESAVKTWCERFQEHSTAKSDLPGYACLRTCSFADESEKPQDKALECAAALIEQLHRESPEYEIGVLVLKNDTVGRLINLLRLRELPASEEGGNPLTDSAAVQVVLSLLRLADHPGDSVARFHVTTSPLGPAWEFPDHQDLERASQIAAKLRHDLQVLGLGDVIQRNAKTLRDHCSPRDQNRLEQLVELAYSYQSRMKLRADEFVRFVEYKRIAEPTRAPIRVMTVHQAKGLEFDTVVLPELDSDLTGERPPSFVIERSDPVAPISRVCRYVSRELQMLLHPDIRKMFDDAADHKVSESLCVLYVALTRAIHALHIIISPSRPNERTFPRTLGGIVRSALCGSEPVAPDRVLYELGDSKWYQKRQTTIAEVVKESASSFNPEPTARASATEKRPTLAPLDYRRRGLERIRPSLLEGGNFVRMRSWLESENQAAILRGTVLHACFEQIAWLDDGPPPEAVLRQRISDVLREEGQSEDASKWLSDFGRAIQHPDIDAQLRRKVYQDLERLGFSADVAQRLRGAKLTLTVENERPFAVVEAGGLLSGTMDRLVLLRSEDKIMAADILDFKTDFLPREDDAALRERVNYYSPQLAAYRRAVGKMTGLPLSAIVARLLFVTTGQVVKVES
jgi:ATP-dependent helicase/nuclease subunit A